MEFSLFLPKIVSVLFGMETITSNLSHSGSNTYIILRPTGFCRYSYDVPRELPSKKTWIESVNRRMYLILNLWKDYPEKSSKKQAMLVMKNFTSGIERTNLGTGKSCDSCHGNVGHHSTMDC